MLLNQRLHQCLIPVRKELILCLQAQHTAAKASPVSPVLTQEVKPVFRYADEFSEKFALHDTRGEYTYRSLFNSSIKLSKEISRLLQDKHNERVAFLCPNEGSYIITQWAAWMSGQVVVPLSKSLPPNLLEYYITDSSAQLVVTTPEYSEMMYGFSSKTKAKLFVLDEELINEAVVQKEATSAKATNNPPSEPSPRVEFGLDPDFYTNSDAMIVYTSGTTGNPKGVVLTHKNIHHQVQSMISAWGWTSKDVLLHTLPVHHVLGIVNGLIAPLSIGAKVLMLPEFSCSEVWSHLLVIKKQLGDKSHLIGNKVTVFIGLPSMYEKLIDEYETLFLGNKRQMEFIKTILSQKIRLMASGSAPLRPHLVEKWKEISGHNLIEKYEMTETGIVLGTPLTGNRKCGFVGQPVPGMRVRITSKENPEEVLVEGDSLSSNVVAQPEGNKSIVGDLLVSGPNVFRAYWNKPKATAKEFVQNDWFKTGDTAEYVDGCYKILGRSSVDIIKTGGFKVSALEVESKLLEHELIEDVAVVGVPDPTWGEKVAAIVVLTPEKNLQLSELRDWCKSKMPPHTIPTEMKIVDEIPKSETDKINKKELLKKVFNLKQQPSSYLVN